MSYLLIQSHLFSPFCNRNSNYQALKQWVSDFGEVKVTMSGDVNDSSQAAGSVLDGG